MASSHSAEKSVHKMAILNLALVRKQDWEDCVLEVTGSFEETQVKKAEGKWYYQGELERKLGKSTARRHIKVGKYEEGEDADGEKMYRKVQHSDWQQKSLTSKVQATKTTTIEETDFKSLTESMSEFFGKSSVGKVGPKKTLADGEGASLLKLKDRAFNTSESLKRKGAADTHSAKTKQTKKAKTVCDPVLLDIQPPKDPDSKSDEIEARNRVKQALAKMQSKMAEMDGLMTGIGKKPDALGLSVKQQASEVKTKMRAQISLLTKMSVMVVDKVRVDDFKNAVQAAVSLVGEGNRVKMCARPHMTSKAPSAASV